MKVSLSAVRSITAVLFALAGGPTWSDEATPAMGAVPDTRALPDWYAPAPLNPAWSAGSWEPLPPVAPGQEQPGVTAPRSAAVTAEWYQFQAEFEANRAELYSVYQELQNTQALLEHAQAALERSYADYQQGLAEQRLLREQLAGAAAERDRAQTLAMQMQAELEAAKATLAQNREQIASSQTLALSRTEEGAQLRSELADRERHLAELRSELQDATAALSQAQSQAAASRKELLRVQTEAAASREELVTAQSQYRACHAQLVELDAELEGANSETASARQSLAQARAARDALDRALSAREAELAEAEAAVTVAREEAEQLRQAGGGLAGGLATQAAQESVAMMTTGTLPAGLDVDQDGVSDSRDLCPETETGVAVGPTGCVLNATMTLEGVGFRYDSHELTDESHAILDRVAGILEQYPDLKLEVAGHADAQGDPAYNLWLSRERAETVRKYLITQGVKRDNLTARGYGAEQPVADNSTWEGLVRNRRVELRRRP